MRKLFHSIRTLCLMAIACMVSANALAYNVYVDADISVTPQWTCKILVVDKNATVANCTVGENGVLIIEKGITVTVTDVFSCDKGTIYVFGTLNIERTSDHGIGFSTVYVMQGGSIVGTYNNTGSTIETNVNLTDVGSIEKVDAQIPTADNDYAGWPDYYQQLFYYTDKTDFYPLYYEDVNCTKPIADVVAWKNDWKEKYTALAQARDEAKTEIDLVILMGEITDETILAIANKAKEDINAATMVEQVDIIKAKALADIALAKAKADAIAEITAAREGIQNENLDNWIDAAINDIKNSEPDTDEPSGPCPCPKCPDPGIDEIKEEILNIINLFKEGKAAGIEEGKAAAKAELPTDPEGTAGTAVEITKGTKSVTLINPDKVKYVRIEN